MPTPTPIALGAAILIIAVPESYPLPPLTIFKELIVPAADTVAVNLAAIGSIGVFVSNALKTPIWIADSFSS